MPTKQMIGGRAAATPRPTAGSVIPTKSLVTKTAKTGAGPTGIMPKTGSLGTKAGGGGGGGSRVVTPRPIAKTGGGSAPRTNMPELAPPARKKGRENALTRGKGKKKGLRRLMGEPSMPARPKKGVRRTVKKRTGY